MTSKSTKKRRCRKRRKNGIQSNGSRSFVAFDVVFFRRLSRRFFCRFLPRFHFRHRLYFRRFRRGRFFRRFFVPFDVVFCLFKRYCFLSFPSSLSTTSFPSSLSMLSFFRRIRCRRFFASFDVVVFPFLSTPSMLSSISTSSFFIAFHVVVPLSLLTFFRRRRKWQKTMMSKQHCHSIKYTLIFEYRIIEYFMAVMAYIRNNYPIQGRSWTAPCPSALIQGRILAAPNILSSSLPRFADWGIGTKFQHNICHRYMHVSVQV